MSGVPATTVQIVQAAGTLTLSTLALVWSIYSWRATRAAEHEKQRRESEKRDDELLAWSGRAIAVMADIQALAHNDPAAWDPGGFDRRRIRLSGEASAILDQGRVFFPNVDAAGREAPRDREFRARILDELKLAHLVAEDIRAATPVRNRARGEELWEARKRFVSYLRDIMGTKRLVPGEAGRMGRSVRLNPLGPEPAKRAPPRRRAK